MKYTHRKSGAQVEVADHKVMDPQEWEKAEAPARKPARKRAESSEDD